MQPGSSRLASALKVCSLPACGDDPPFPLITTWSLRALSTPYRLVLDIQPVIRSSRVLFGLFSSFNTRRLEFIYGTAEINNMFCINSAHSPISASFNLEKRLEGWKISCMIHILLDTE